MLVPGRLTLHVGRDHMTRGAQSMPSAWLAAAQAVPWLGTGWWLDGQMQSYLKQSSSKSPPFCLPVKRGKRRKAVSQSNTDRRKPVQLQFLPHRPNPIRQTRPPARVSPQHSHGLVALTEVSICEYLVFPGKLTPTSSKQMSYLFLLLMHPRLALS